MATYPSLDRNLELEKWRDLLAPLIEDLVGIDTSVSMLCGEKEAADDTLKLCVHDYKGRPRLAILVSSEVEPALVARAMERAAAARRVLGDELGGAILEPLRTGVFEGRSFTVLPYVTPMRQRGVLGRVQRRQVVPVLLDWLHGAAARTLADVGSARRETCFERQLEHLLEREGISGRARTVAEYSLGRLRDGKWPARHVLMHGDLWAGNVLLAPSGILKPPHPVLIDWPGAMVRGYAIFDLIRLTRSFRLSPATLRPELERHAEVLGCEVEDTRGHLLAALGHHGLDLGHFPVRRYLAMVEFCLDTISEAL